MDNCESIRDLLEAYADGELTEKQKELVEHHIAHCPHCAALLDEYLALNAVIADCAVQAPEGFAERVMAAVEQEKKSIAKPQGRGVRLGKIAPWIGFGVAALLCVSIASSSLVKYVIGHLADPDFSVETSAGELLDPESPNPPQEESPTLDAPTASDTKEECITQEVIPEDTLYEETGADSVEMPTNEETAAESIESPTHEPTEGTTPPTGESGGAQDGVPEQDFTEAVTQPEIQEPVTTVAPETAQPETEGAAKPEVEGVTPPETEEQPAPEEQEPMTDAVTEQAESRGFFARAWQAIKAFFANLWQAVSRLFGGEA